MITILLLLVFGVVGAFFSSMLCFSSIACQIRRHKARLLSITNIMSTNVVIFEYDLIRVFHGTIIYFRARSNTLVQISIEMIGARKMVQAELANSFDTIE